jgi:hypothetical protein
MTSGIGAALPLQVAPPAVDGEVADSAASQPFLAALAAAVAAPVTPPPAPVVDVPLVVSDAAVAEDGEPSVGEESMIAGEGELLTLIAPRSSDVRKEVARRAAEAGEAAEAAATEADAAPDVSEATGDRAASEGKGSRLRVEIADRAAPRPVELRAAPVAEHPSRADAAAPTRDSGDEEAVSRGKALGASIRAEPAAPAAGHEPTQATVPAPASWHAAAQALATPSRAPALAPELQRGPDRSPEPAMSTMKPDGGGSGRPTGAASSTAAGVLAAMHAAHLAKDATEVVDAPVARFAAQVIATLTPTRGASEENASKSGGLAAEAKVASGDVSEPAPLPTPLRVTVSARAAASHAEQDSTHDHREEPPAQDRRTLTPASIGTTDAPVSTGRAPWMTGEAPTMPSAAEVAKPTATATVHRTAEPPATPLAPSSQVTVELDAERTGAQRVRVAVRGDVVHATVVTDRGGADAMRPQLDELRHALEGQGFREAHVQLRVAGDGTPAVSGGGSPELRLRSDASSRAPDGSGTEPQPRGRQRGQDQQPPPGGQPAFEEELL